MAEQNKPSGDKKQPNLIEQNLWDLGDDDDQVELTENNAPTPISSDEAENMPTPQVSAISATEKAEESTHSSEGVPLDSEKENGVDESPDIEDLNDDLSSDDLTLTDEELSLQTSSDSPTEINPASAEPTTEQRNKPALLDRLSAIEKASLGLFLLFLIGLFIWLATSFAPPDDWIKEKAPAVSFPVKGTSVTIEEVRTAWREPSRTGDARDRGVRLDIRLMPVADITLKGSGSGQLRFIFQNADGEIIGDTITETIANGQFGGQNKTIEIHSTDGFEDKALFNNYTQKQIRSWTLSIYEVNAQQADSKALLTVPIAATLKNNQ